MAIIKRTTGERLPIPHEPGEWVAIRPLNFGELEEADDQRTKRVLAQVQGLDLSSLQAQRTGERKDRDILATYDISTVLKYGLVSWSYSEDLDDDSLNWLDSKTAQWVAREILKRSVMSEEEGEASASPSEPQPTSAATGQ